MLVPKISGTKDDASITLNPGLWFGFAIVQKGNAFTARFTTARGSEGIIYTHRFLFFVIVMHLQCGRGGIFGSHCFMRVIFHRSTFWSTIAGVVSDHGVDLIEGSELF